MEPSQSVDRDPGFQPHKGRIEVEIGRTWYPGRARSERRMNNLPAPRGGKSFSLNILPVSSLKSKICAGNNILAESEDPADDGGVR